MCILIGADIYCGTRAEHNINTCTILVCMLIVHNNIEYITANITIVHNLIYMLIMNGNKFKHVFMVLVTYKHVFCASCSHLPVITSDFFLKL